MVFLYIFISLLCLIGISSLVRGIAFLSLGCDRDVSLYHIIILNSGNPEIELRSAVEQLNWSNLRNSKTLFVVDGGLTSDAKQVAKKFCDDYRLTFCESDELGKVLKTTVNGQRIRNN